jgi:hypothetical protein
MLSSMHWRHVRAANKDPLTLNSVLWADEDVLPFYPWESSLAAVSICEPWSRSRRNDGKKSAPVGLCLRCSRLSKKEGVTDGPCSHGSSALTLSDLHSGSYKIRCLMFVWLLKSHSIVKCFRKTHFSLSIMCSLWFSNSCLLLRTTCHRGTHYCLFPYSCLWQLLHCEAKRVFSLLDWAPSYEG